MAAVVALTREHGNAVFQKDALMEAPANEIGQVVRADNQRETVFRFALLQRVKSIDGILWR